MDYLESFLVDFSGTGCFFGLPLPGTLRMVSSALSGYIASFISGFIPAVSSRLWTVLYGIPKIFAISCIVMPFIIINLLSEKIKPYLSIFSINTIQAFSNIGKNFVFLLNFSIFCLTLI